MHDITLITGQPRDLGDGFVVQRLLPAAARRRVGPFVFVDHFGPVTLAAGHAMDVRPHPHIGLATITYLFDGEILHRDSLGTVQRIVAGDVNLMTAGRGIVHSERTPDDLRVQSRSMHGMQTWVGLPLARAEDAPAFQHVAATALHVWRAAGAQVRVVLGDAFGLRSPVVTASPTLFCALELQAGARIDWPAAAPEQALYVAQGALRVGEVTIGARQMALLPAKSLTIEAQVETRAVLLGGDPLDGPDGGHRHLWWNFVASDRARIDAAKRWWADLTARDPGAGVPGEVEHIALPVR